MKNSIHFTKKNIEKLTAGDNKEVYFTDDKQKSLQLRVSKTGVKTFYFYKWNSEKRYPEKLPLGNFPAISVEQARALAAKTIVDFDEKKAVSSRTRAVREPSPSSRLVKDLWLEYRAAVSVSAAPSFDRNYGGPYNQHFDEWYERDVESIEVNEVQKWVNSIATSVGRPCARTCHAVLRQFLNWCIESKKSRVPNPCCFVKAPAPSQRLRFLKPGDEFNRFMAALDAYKNQNLCDIFRVLLWTGARLNSVLAMKWSDIDLEGAGTWHIPAANSKNKKGYTIGLTEAVFKLLKRRRANINSDYVFPAAGKGKKPYITKVWVAFRQILKDAGITDFRIHDLRHTLASYMAMSGADLPKIAKQLGHKSLRSTEVYVHLINESAQFAAEDALDAMRNPSLILLRKKSRKPSTSA